MKQVDVDRLKASKYSRKLYLYDEALERKIAKKKYRRKNTYIFLFLMLAVPITIMLIGTPMGYSRYDESGLSIYYLYIGYCLGIIGSIFSFLALLRVGHFRIDESGIYLSFTKKTLKEIFIPFSTIEKIIIYISSDEDLEFPRSIYLLSNNNPYTTSTKRIEELIIIDEIIPGLEICNPKKVIAILKRYLYVETYFQDQIEFPHISQYFKLLRTFS